MLWDVNVSLLVDALSNEEAETIVESFLRTDGRNTLLDYNFMVHSVEKTDGSSLKALRDGQSERKLNE